MIANDEMPEEVHVAKTLLVWQMSHQWENGCYR